MLVIVFQLNNLCSWANVFKFKIHKVSGNQSNLLELLLAKAFFYYNTQVEFGARVAQLVRSLDLATHTSLSPIRRGFAPSFVNYKKKGALDSQLQVKVYQLLVHGRWLSSGTLASSPWYSWNIVERGVKIPKIKSKNQNRIWLIFLLWLLVCLSSKRASVFHGHIFFV